MKTKKGTYTPEIEKALKANDVINLSEEKLKQLEIHNNISCAYAVYLMDQLSLVNSWTQDNNKLGIEANKIAILWEGIKSKHLNEIRKLEKEII